MDRLRRMRRPIRARVTKTVTSVEEELLQDPVNLVGLQAQWEKLDELLEELCRLDRAVMDALLDADGTDEEQDEEDKSTEEYRDKIRLIKIKLLSVLKPHERPGSRESSHFSTVFGEEKKRNFKLPKIELKKFNGELEEWLGWWAQFSKIHEDEQLHESDKFQYLIQSMVPGTRAANLVKSFPATVENYVKVIDTLKDRFGDKAFLAEVYIRKLQSVVLGLERSKAKVDLCRIYDDIETQLRCLESLEVKLDHSAFLLPLIESTLPIEIVKVWQRTKEAGYLEEENRTTEERLKSLMKFLRSEVKGEERIKMIQGKSKESEVTGSSKNRKLHNSPDIPTAHSLYTEATRACVFCDKTNHNSSDCFKAPQLTFEERSKKIKEKRGCFTCFKLGHSSKQCRSQVKCVICGGRHYAIMCRNNQQGNTSTQVPTATEDAKKSNVKSTVANSCKDNQDGLVLMKTVRVNLFGTNGKRVTARLLFDEGSTRSYIKTSTAEYLDCQVLEEINFRTTLFGGVTTASKVKKRYSVKLESIESSFMGEFKFLNEDQICGSCPIVPKGQWMWELKKQKIYVNDTSNLSTDIEILIGSDLWPRLMTGRMSKLQNGLIAVESMFGWTISGELRVGNTNCNFASVVITMMTQGEKAIPEMWELETIGIRETSEKLSDEEHNQKVNQDFIKNISRDSDGRYVIKLPWVNETIPLPTNKGVCERRLKSLTTKLKNEKLYETYGNIFQDWEHEEIIEEVSLNVGSEHYLPHHRVLKLSSKTTPVRPVFDASCRVGNNPSLNECLETGPNLLELIPSILLRFRQKDIGAIADIRKAFQMVKVADEDKNFQKFLWWEDQDSKKLKVYRHCRVVFGMNCSPFVLAAVLNHHLNQVNMEDKKTAELLRSSLYVDNCVISLDSREDYQSFKEESVAILEDAKMNLREWETNCEDDEEELTMVLGLQWNKRSDTLNCKVPQEIVQEMIINKRNVLSMVSKIFDPIGFLCPATIQPKVMLQEAWTKQLSWDEEWKDEDKIKFSKWFEGVNELQKIEIPRVSIGSQYQEIQLHLFTDASQNAYGAVVYARVQSQERVKVQLLLAKSRLAPVSKAKGTRTTIPRLELLGCLIGSRLLQSVKESLKIPDVEVMSWSDSTTALAWIRRDEDWGTFVGNRVREINKLSEKDQWRHVPGLLNPADLPSRGCTPYELRMSRWWEGPSWLYEDREKWPCSQQLADEDLVAEEIKSSSIISNANLENSEPKFSSYEKNLRIAAYVRRFIQNLRASPKDRKVSNILEVKEIQRAEQDVIREIQHHHFSDQKQLGKIRVELKEDGLLHVETRLTYKDDTKLFKSPIVLPNNDPMVFQLIEFVHKIFCHAGTQFVLNKLRERYWILQGRRTVNRVIRKCVVCRRYSSKPLKCDPAPLPKLRIESQYAFQTTGVDLAGPIYLKGAKKAWIVIYTCAVYRGVYLDVVDSLSSEEFLNSLQKFTCLVGRPSTIFSDNGTNFVGAQTMMKKLKWEEVSEKFQVKKIEWKFNPPTAAWWGGFWERLIRTLKDLLRRMIRTAKLTRSELENCMAEISYVINNRPLTTLTENESDLIPLTPSMFMRDLPIGGLPELDLMVGKDYQEAYKKLIGIKTALKARFRKEYLGSLVQMTAEKKNEDPKVGDIVLVGADNRKRFEWPLGRVLEVIPGKDDKMRVVKVKTQNGILLRPIQRLYSLEIPNSLDSKMIIARVQDVRSNQEEVKKIESEEVREISEDCIRPKRNVKKPQRYGQWMN